MELVYGFGIYDSDEPRSSTEYGKTKYNPYYYRWRAMVQRCYDSRSSAHGKAKIEQKWASYSKFKEWMVSQEWEGLALDKDVLSKGEKIYSESTCAFIPVYINSLLSTRSNDRGPYPLGVSYRQKCKTMINEFKKCYFSMVSIDGNQIRLGMYDNVKDAHSAWQVAKAIDIENKVARYAQESCFRTDVADALLARAWKLRLDNSRGEETISL